MMASANAGAAVRDLHRRISGIATALISRDGQVLFAEVPEGTYVETFAIMCATVMGAAVTANAELSRTPPGRILIEGRDSTTIIVASGRNALLVALVDPKVDSKKVLDELAKFADLLETR
jgi:predicted regulator of Ras-like GTPase activity (Roadblock/LC7/MglB family)